MGMSAFVHLAVHGRLGSFQFLALSNKAAVVICVRLSMDLCLLLSCERLWDGMAGLCNVCVHIGHLVNW